MNALNRRSRARCNQNIDDAIYRKSLDDLTVQFSVDGTPQHNCYGVEQ